MTDATLIATIEAAWEDRADIGLNTGGDVRLAVGKALHLLDAGLARVAEPTATGWQVNQWLMRLRANSNGKPGLAFRRDRG